MEKRPNGASISPRTSRAAIARLFASGTTGVPRARLAVAALALSGPTRSMSSAFTLSTVWRLPSGYSFEYHSACGSQSDASPAASVSATARSAPICAANFFASTVSAQFATSAQ